MKKKLLASLLAVTMLVSLFPVSTLALETEETGLCPHHLEHTAECGCIASGEDNPGQPCGYVCRICPVQALIDALPDRDSITEDNRAVAEAQLTAIDEAKAELTDEEAARLDTSRCEAAAITLADQPETDGLMPLETTIIDISSGPVNITESGSYTITGTTNSNNITVAVSGDVYFIFDNLTIREKIQKRDCMTITQGNVYVTLQGTNVIEAHQDGFGCAVKMNAGAYLYFSVDSNDPDGSILLHGASLYGGGSAAVEGGNLHINGGTVSLVGGNKVQNSYGSSFTGESLDLQGGVLNFSASSSENLNLGGGSIDVSGSLTVGPNAEFHIPSNSVVTILNNASLTNDGTITNNGTVTNEGTITNSGTINGAGTMIGNGMLNGGKVLPAVTPPTAASDLTFTGTEYELISAGSTNGGTMQYSLSPDAGYSTEIPTGTDAGTYLVYLLM